ncbi:MAG: transporter [Erythrobacter sp.]|nr:transporter [Erythrobacter sp.]
MVLNGTHSIGLGARGRIDLLRSARLGQLLVRVSPVALAAVAAPALADIPYTTDDPGTLAPGEYEVLAYSDGTFTSMDFEGEAGIDLSVGIADNFQLGVTVPVANFGPQLETDRFAIGDTTVQAKIGLIAGEPGQVSLAVAPTLAVGMASEGRTKTGFDLPIWIGTDIGDWSLYGGGGYSFSSDEDGGDLPFIGAVISKRVIPSLSLGGEFYAQGEGLGGQKLYLFGPGLAWDFAPGLTLAAAGQAVLGDSDGNGDFHVFAALRLAR